MLSEIVVGLLIMIVNPWPAAMFWAKNGIPFLLTLFFTISHGVFCLILFYYGIAQRLAEFAKKWEPLKSLIEKLRGQVKDFQETAPQNYRLQKKLIDLLMSKGKTITLILTFVPWVIILPSATIIAARLMKIRYAPLILLVGGIFRNTILCLTVYGLNAVL